LEQVCNELGINIEHPFSHEAKPKIHNK